MSTRSHKNAHISKQLTIFLQQETKNNMKKQYLLLLFVAMMMNLTTMAYTELFNRGVVAVHKPSGGNFISWRLLPNDPKGITYTLLRNGLVIKSGLTVTCFNDANGNASSKYQVVAKNGDETIDTSAETQTWSDVYKSMTLERPAGGLYSYKEDQLGTNNPTKDSIGYYSYYIHEASVADVDNDGEWEILVKWNDTAAKDNAHDGYTGRCILDCYHLNPYVGDEAKPERLWRIDLGPNIRTGSHYTQFMFYDFNGDGKAEMICKTGPGSKDGQGNYVTEAADDETIKATDNTKDWRTRKGRIMDGPEFLTVFDGLTGKAIHTIWYNPNRGMTTGRSSAYTESWGDNYGNRGERFLACVAHLDGMDKPASAVMCRGYYTRAYLWAVDFDGQKLSTKWLHASVSKNRVEVTDANGQKTAKTYKSNTSGKGDAYTAYGQGCHSIAVGDVDGDGCDEIIYGSAAIDNDGQLLYSTGLGHGDAHHLADLYPDRPGLEFMMPHEESNNGWSVRDAATGELLIWKPSTGDNGRGMAADIDLNHRGSEFWSAADYNVYGLDGSILSTNHRPRYCFRIYWDGTLKEDLLDGGALEAYTGNGNTRLLNFEGVIKNGSKAYPVLSADLFGDWREEAVFCSSADSCTLRIYSSTYDTKFSVPTLMSDHLYRMSVAWQNVAYNQPPHLSYYLPDVFASRFNVIGEGMKEQSIALGESIKPIVCQLENCTSAMVYASFLDGKKVKTMGVPDGFSFAIDRTTSQFTLTGTPQQSGIYEIIVRSSGDITGNRLEDTLRVVVTDATGIAPINPSSVISNNYYDMQGRRVEQPVKGFYIVNRKKVIIR